MHRGESGTSSFMSLKGFTETLGARERQFWKRKQCKDHGDLNECGDVQKWEGSSMRPTGRIMQEEDLRVMLGRCHISCWGFQTFSWKK